MREILRVSPGELHVLVPVGVSSILGNLGYKKKEEKKKKNPDSLVPHLMNMYFLNMVPTFQLCLWCPERMLPECSRISRVPQALLEAMESTLNGGAYRTLYTQNIEAAKKSL